MPLARIPAHARTALIVLAVALSLAACGRRGALEPPPGPSTQTQAAGQRGGAVIDGDDDDDTDSVVSSPVPGGQKKRPKGITIPNKPFILDSLL